MADSYFKELIPDKRTGKLREATTADIVERDAPAAAKRARGERELQKQENFDRALMTKKAADAKWNPLRRGMPPGGK